MKLTNITLMALATSLTLRGAEPDYTLHEWGTFTTVSGSDGVLLSGLEREEEPLPSFVYSHEGMGPLGPLMGVPGSYVGTPGSYVGFTGVQFKGINRPLKGVTVKMETPVIYFYTKEKFAAQVKVGFAGGSISQWFPPRSGGETPPPLLPIPSAIQNESDQAKRARLYTEWNAKNGLINFAKGYKGGIEWNVTVEPPSPATPGRVFRSGETPTWTAPRLADSALVRSQDGMEEKFLFYRGLGHFPMPATFRGEDEGSVTVENTGSATIPAVFIFQNTAPGIRWLASGPVMPGEKKRLSLAGDPHTYTPVAGKPAWHQPVYDAMVSLLEGAGLYPAEAHGMVQTWWRSYFETAGFRVFWILPESETERILPLSVTPAPRKKIRVLVGRTEIMTPDFEKQLLDDYTKAEAEPNQGNHWLSNRFGLAYTERVKALRHVVARR